MNKYVVYVWFLMFKRTPPQRNAACNARGEPPFLQAVQRSESDHHFPEGRALLHRELRTPVAFPGGCC